MKKLVVIFVMFVMIVGSAFAGLRAIPKVSYTGPEEYRELVISLCEEYFSGPNFPKNMPTQLPIYINLDVISMENQILCCIEIGDDWSFLWNTSAGEIAEMEFFNLRPGDDSSLEKLAVIGTFYMMIRGFWI